MGRNEDKKNMKICSHCGKKVAAGSTTCPHCGIALKVPPKIPLEKIKYAKPKEKSTRGDGKKSSTTEEEPKWKEGKNWAKKSLKPTSQRLDEPKLMLSAVVASLLCFIAGVWMLSIKGGGETPTIFESAFHATGLYFIAKGFFLGPALYMMGKKRA